MPELAAKAAPVQTVKTVGAAFPGHAVADARMKSSMVAFATSCRVPWPPVGR
jgi:hypothetical protein